MTLLRRLVISRLVTDPIVIAVFVVSSLNAFAWSLVTPPFQVPDETAHFAYAQRLAESGLRPGDRGRPEFSSEQTQTLDAIGTLGIIGRPLVRPAGSASADRQIGDQLARITRGAPRGDGGGPSTATSQPPLYYGLMAVPYRIFGGSSLLTRLEAMRIVSALIFASGAAICGLFAHELLPGFSGAKIAGGLAIGLSPYAAFICSGVNPDALLLTMSSLTLMLVARGFRRGTGITWFVTFGLTLIGGVLTKLTFLAFVPPGIGVAFYFAVRSRRQLLTELSAGLKAIAPPVAILCALPLIVCLWLVATGKSLTASSTATPSLTATTIKSPNTREMISYAWQLFFPRLPFMTDQFGFAPLTQTWIDGFAGRFGWLDYNVSHRVVHAFRVFMVVTCVLALCSAVRFRSRWTSRYSECVTYAGFAALLAAAIARSGYEYHRTTGLIFEQARYLFPISAFYAAAVALACRALGSRMAPALVVVLVSLLGIHDAAGFLTTLARYYA